MSRAPNVAGPAPRGKTPWKFQAGAALVFGGLVWASQSALLWHGRQNHLNLAVSAATINAVRYSKGFHVTTSAGDRFALPVLLDARTGYAKHYEPAVGQTIEKTPGRYELMVDGEPAIDKGSLDLKMTWAPAKVGVAIAAAGVVVWLVALLQWLLKPSSVHLASG